MALGLAVSYEPWSGWHPSYSIALGLLLFFILRRIWRWHSIKSMAERWGFSYSGDAYEQLAGTGAELFKRGNPIVRNYLVDEVDGLRVSAFDLDIPLEGADLLELVLRFRFSAALAPIDAVLPSIIIEERGAWNWLARKLFSQVGPDVTGPGFESGAFQRRYRVIAKDALWAHTFVDARMMQFLLNCPRGTSFQVAMSSVLCYRRPVAARKIQGMMWLAARMTREIPRVAREWDLLGGSRSTEDW